MKRLYSLALPLLCLLALCLPSHAQSGVTVQQSSTARKILFLMVDSTDHVSAKTGLTPTVTISKNGATFASPAGTVAESGNGWYSLTPTSADTGTVGALIVHASGTGADPVDVVENVVAYNPDDAAGLGLSRVDAAISTRNATAPDNTTITAINTKLGTPAGASISADTAANLTAINSKPSAAQNATALLNSVPNSVNIANSVESVLYNLRAGLQPVIVADYAAGKDPATLTWAAGARTLTAQADTSGVTTLLSRVPGTLPTLAQMQAGLPTETSIWTYSVDGSLSAKTALAGLFSGAFGKAVNTYNTGTHTLTTTYYKQDGTTAFVVNTTVYGAGASAPVQVSRPTATVTP